MRLPARVLLLLPGSHRLKFIINYAVLQRVGRHSHAVSVVAATGMRRAGKFLIKTNMSSSWWGSLCLEKTRATFFAPQFFIMRNDDMEIDTWQSHGLLTTGMSARGVPYSHYNCHNTLCSATCS